MKRHPIGICGLLVVLYVGVWVPSHFIDRAKRTDDIDCSSASPSREGLFVTPSSTQDPEVAQQMNYQHCKTGLSNIRRHVAWIPGSSEAL
ncbi:hypothetical protein [Methylovirgula sp. 4M-Z18]|uniref:hypothetical protein n=1 Tax=Methylovirgula sp. 4M-Z18 TaxID=2293567 RepID=UPI000E2F82AD|nr:hypothetical protein [Methylovirgula sp. 4M-Z18]RFB76303.1 hypothetical protein DYH55_20915 [Methylovirgula sp. 4M-Z18]